MSTPTNTGEKGSFLRNISNVSAAAEKKGGEGGNLGEDLFSRALLLSLRYLITTTELNLK